jgi:GTP-binding protein
LFNIIIVGRPNVGKSTLFNRLTHSKAAIIEDTPGVTRDWQEKPGNIGPMHFNVIDTAGLDRVRDASALTNRMTEQTEAVLPYGDVLLFVVDARSGVTATDSFFARWLKKQNKPVILIANKAEGKSGEAGANEAFSLGFGAAVKISAAHNEGMIGLYETLLPYYEKHENEQLNLSQDEEEKNSPIKIAIVGRPNAGKSTLINNILGANRLLTGPEAGITRDAIEIKWEWRGHEIALIDTAGLRRRTNITTPLEKFSATDSLQAINFSQIVIILMDIREALEKQDLYIINEVINEGRAVLLAFNKCDSLSARELKKYQQEIAYKLEHNLPHVFGIGEVYLSALKDKNFNMLFEEAISVYHKWDTRLPTAKLNEWLSVATEKHPLPMNKNGKRMRIKYITQYKKRPPTFILFTTSADIPDSYIKYLTKDMRAHFNMQGVPIRIVTRKKDNPYEKK